MTLSRFVWSFLACFEKVVDDDDDDDDDEADHGSVISPLFDCP